jgi:predicted nucleic acid-binding protein
VILVDTSVWIDHLRRGDPLLASLLSRERVLTHPFVFGELLLGNLRTDDDFIESWAGLATTPVAEDEEVQVLIARGRLAGSGIGYVDAHLLAAIRLMPGTSLWTRDRRLATVAERLGVAARPHDS